jgi:AcrR family transcriptional regulator
VIVSFRERQRAFREREILRAARSALADRGCRALTMAELAGRLGMSKATLYQHFASREELLRRAVGEAWREALAGALAAADGLVGSQRSRRAVEELLRNLLGVGAAPGEPRPCCLAEIECPFLEVDELGRWLAGLGVESSPDGIDPALALRALAVAVYQRRRAAGQQVTAEEADAIARCVLSRP